MVKYTAHNGNNIGSNPIKLKRVANLIGRVSRLHREG